MVSQCALRVSRQGSHTHAAIVGSENFSRPVCNFATSEALNQSIPNRGSTPTAPQSQGNKVLVWEYFFGISF
eukprot:2816247-Amphidinium_carterae.1